MTLVMCWSDLESYPILVSAQNDAGESAADYRATQYAHKFYLVNGCVIFTARDNAFFRGLQVEQVSWLS